MLVGGWGRVDLFSTKKLKGVQGRDLFSPKKKLMGVQMKATKKCALTNCYPCKNRRGAEASTSSRSFVALPHGS
jgi:hypothetical protein